MLINPLPRHPVISLARRKWRSPATRGNLVATGISFRGPGNTELHDISIDAPPGTTTHVLSSSTTHSNALLGLLVGLYPPDTGSIKLDDADLTSLPLTTARSSVLLVLADPWIMAGTIADNIAFGDPSVTRERIETVAKLVCVDEVAARFTDGLETVIGDDGVHLSTGARRLVALARALLRNPPVLLLEDPFRDLTAREETLTIKAVNRASAGRTTIITTRSFDPTMFSTDQVLYLEDGRLETGSIETPADTSSGPIGPGQSSEHRADRPWRAAVGEEIVDGYRAAGLLHRWDNTETWLAWHGASETIVEARIPRSTSTIDEARVEIGNEYDRAVQLHHPGIVRPVEAHLSGDIPIATYERVEGQYLSHLIGYRQGQADLDLVAIGTDLARALAHLHRLEFAHLDLGLHVVKVGPDGSVIADLKRLLPIGSDQERTYEAHERGVIAPEQLLGAPASPAMDIYGLGTILFQAATATFVTSQSGPDLAKLHHPANEIDPDLARTIEAMLESDPFDRPNASEVLAMVRATVLPPPTAGWRKPVLIDCTKSNDDRSQEHGHNGNGIRRLEEDAPTVVLSLVGTAAGHTRP